MVKLALFVRLEAKPGKESAVEDFLTSGLPLVQQEPATTTWYGIKLGPSTWHFRYLPGRFGKAGAPFGQSRPSIDGESIRAFFEAAFDRES